MMTRCLHVLALVATASAAADCKKKRPTDKKPNIMFFIADDLGWNDIDFHGSPQIPSPKISSICKNGVEFNRYYGQPVCSPTRATILSGRHAIHSGVYNYLIPGDNTRLNTSYKLLPEYLKDEGYDAHMVGKWHLGQNTLDTLPNHRGFDSYLGFWSGAQDWYAHTIGGPAGLGYDFQLGDETAFEYDGVYSTYAFTDKIVETLTEKYSGADHNPFFYYVAFQNPHWPLDAPQMYVDMCSGIEDYARRYVCAMTLNMDHAIGKVMRTLADIGELDNTIVVFTSDNGGPTNGTEGTQSNNYPLRGGKSTLWEGGTRLGACMQGPGVPKGEVWNGLMHTTDWLPTLMEAAGAVPPEAPQPGDGMSVWSSISTANQTSPRSWILYETHPDPFSVPVMHGHALLSGDMKIIWTGAINPIDQFGWFPPPGQDPSTVQYSVSCGTPPATPADCSKGWCLFNVTADPCEHTDIAAENPAIVQSLVEQISVYQETAVPPTEGVGCMPFIDSAGAWRTCG